jgi:nucleoside-diphosphate-sugar epimerase/glycosyltransferase involved in cell wall biosynthesis
MRMHHAHSGKPALSRAVLLQSGTMPQSPSAPLQEKIQRLQGPILVLGASGFVGANLLRMMLPFRGDVFGTARRLPSWRLAGVPASHLRVLDLLVDSDLDELLTSIKPRTIFDCVAYGAYSFEEENGLIYRTNFDFVSRLLTRLDPFNTPNKIAAYVHAGTSSEYGDNAAGPLESAFTAPNSHYAVSKVAAANLIYYYGKKRDLPCANLRLYSVYGPMEDSSRLIPVLVRHGLEKRYPPLTHPDTSRDFLYVDDACEAFFDTALELLPGLYGESFNIASGKKTTIADVAAAAAQEFGIAARPEFSMQGRRWDLSDWFGDISKAREHLHWQPRTGFGEGLRVTAAWYSALQDKDAYEMSTKRLGLDTEYSVSAIVACYRDNQAIPIMYERLKKTFTKLNIDYEIIFVNDCSPDDSEEVIRILSEKDGRVLGISHSRNFGSQAGFRSGMEIASKNACVLLDGDLQDPPELIERFVEAWRQGNEVIFGRRVKREATLFMQTAYKLFYRVFDAFSYIPIPRDAGDFSLIDRRVVQALLRFPERDLFVRGIRAYAGFKQTGIDYVRPERMFGVTTNSFWKNVGWAKKGIFSFSYVPLNILSLAGVFLFVLTLLLMLYQLILQLVAPALTPRGVTTLLLAVLFFGSLNIFALSMVGEYIAKIFEEVKRRPHFIRCSFIRNGKVRATALSNEAPPGINLT